MTAPNPRDPRLRRQHDPLAAAVRLSMSADAMRGELLVQGPEPLDEKISGPTAASSHLAPEDFPSGDLDVDLAAMFAAVQGTTAGERITADEFAAALEPVDEPEPYSLAAADELVRDLAHDLAVEPVAESPAPTSAPVPVTPPPAPTSVEDEQRCIHGRYRIDPCIGCGRRYEDGELVGPFVTEQSPAFSPERSRPRPAWRSRHDPRSRAYGVRRPGVVDGSTPLQNVLLPTGPVLDQIAAGATLEEQSCCTGTGTVAAVNTLLLEAGLRHGMGGPGGLLDLDAAEAVYELGKRRDQYPGEDYAGGSVLGAMTAAVELGHIGGFLWCFGTRDIAQTILRRRPVVVGVPWPSGMWETGPGGLVLVQGADEGLGHCLAIVGITLKGPQGQPGPFFRWQQSAGESYGDGGFGWIHHRDLAGLLRGRGEAASPTLEPQEPTA